MRGRIRRIIRGIDNAILLRCLARVCGACQVSKNVRYHTRIGKMRDVIEAHQSTSARGCSESSRATLELSNILILRLDSFFDAAVGLLQLKTQELSLRLCPIVGSNDLAIYVKFWAFSCLLCRLMVARVATSRRYLRLRFQCPHIYMRVF